MDTNNVGQMVDLVERNKADECLARVICELSFNPNSHGENGNKFARSLLKFRQSQHPKIKKYIEAINDGAKSKNRDQCKRHHPTCTHETSEIITVGNKLLKVA